MKKCDRPECEAQTDNPRFCSRSCAAKVTNLETDRQRGPKPADTTVFCSQCSKRTKGYAKQTLLCRLCYIESYIERFLSGELDASYDNGGLTSLGRKAVLKRAKYSCEICGWCEVHPLTGVSPVQVDHIDGDPSNNLVSNLRVLCPNHHALTETFGRINSVEGRKKYGLPALNKPIRPNRRK
jgi:hypothetical protein